jgi:hypothetical protein
MVTESLLLDTARAQTYCSANSNNYMYEWIKSVSVANLQNAGVGSAYSDFTALTANLTQGQSISYELIPGFRYSTFIENWAVFIDFNQNGSFDDGGERIVSASSSGTVSGTYIVPTDALTGQTRMRVVMKWGSSPTSCNTFSYGEVEDYTVSIAASASEMVKTDVDEIGFQTFASLGAYMLASTVLEDPGYGTTFRHYTYSYEANNGNDGKTQLYIIKQFPLETNISQAEVVDADTNQIIATKICDPSTIDISCNSYLDVPLGLEQRVRKTFSVRYSNPQDNNVARYEYRFTLASAKLKR